MNIHQKTVILTKKNDESILEGGDFITIKPMKTYQN